MSCCSACKSEPCSCARSFVDPTAPSYDPAHTLARSLVSVVDAARDIYACLGLRAYTVTLVWTRWSGGERGVGSEVLLREKDLLPVPRVSQVSALSRGAESIGVLEQGELRVDQISASYGEAILLGVQEGEPRIPQDISFYWEVRAVSPDGPQPRRRFYPSGTPSLDMTRMQWTVRLVRASADRQPDGAP